MAALSRHGLHVVGDDEAPAAEPIPTVLLDTRGRACPSLQQQSVVLRIGGLLDADAAGRLRMSLSTSTVAGGPRELVLDLAAVHAVDERRP